MKTITREIVEQTVRNALPGLAFDVPGDVLAGLERALEIEEDPRASEALRLLVENARIASEDRVAICQDTGSVWICLEAGPDVAVAGDALLGVNDAVAAVYTDCRLRKSLVRDALFDRANTGDNTPAFCEVSLVDKPGARLHIMCKGGGSDNASRVVMLTPSAGREGVVEAVLACVREKADDLLDAVNATGIGAAALGGRTTALAVHVETAPCHIAALPLAINMGCSATRRGTYEL